MSSLADKATINPLAVYTLEETSDFLETDPRTTSKVIRGGELTARKIGQGYKVLGESILRYLGSVSVENIQPPMNSLAGTPTQKMSEGLTYNAKEDSGK